MLFEMIIFFLGVTLIVSAVTNILKNHHVKKEGVPVEAAVVDIHKLSKAGKNKSYTIYHPVFEYRVDGKLTRSQGSGKAQVPYPIGTIMEIRYDPNNPERIVTLESPAKGHIAPILIGFVFTIGSVLSMLNVNLPEVKGVNGIVAFIFIFLLMACFILILIRSLRKFVRKTKRNLLEGKTASNVLVVAKEENNTVVFEFINGNRIRCVVPESVYNELLPRDRGMLTFKKLQFIRFERTYRQREG